MIEYKLIDKSNSHVVYEYYPEGKSNSQGIIEVDLHTEDYTISKRPEIDSLGRYALKMYRKIVHFIEEDNFPEDGMIAWY